MIYRKIRTLSSHFRRYGFKSSFDLVKGKLRSGGFLRALQKTNVVEFYDFVKINPFGSQYTGGDVKSVTWFIPAFGYGSGGHLNIFRFIAGLEKNGIECRIAIVNDEKSDSATRKRQICEWFVELKAEVYTDLNKLPECHIAFATSWQTAYYVRNFKSTKHKLYFVQDFEPWFYAVGSEAILAENTYKFGFVGVTAGDWLKDKLRIEYEMETTSVGFSYEKDMYYPRPRLDADVKCIFFYARPPTARRAFELGLLVLDQVVKVLPNVKVIFAGWDVSNYHIPYEHLNAGTLSLAELPDLYSRCDVALVLSFTNLSLLPLELMASGVPVISNSGPWVEWLLNKENCILTDATVEGLSAGLVSILSDEKLHKTIVDAGMKFAASTNWDVETDKLCTVIKKYEAK
ncbi:MULTISPECIES: glycosyltransferase family 4 protein [Deefgea]|uniref:Glycosyltransferase n=1 Tax=Deefgea chitinilytica TaxID=570276 RepID=A0ABS2C782_9NEIS|nr:MULTISPECIES: glycosyltransferase family 4 protein [Deefgea]MBM5570018.1 glycosyltransferase [Deefgea chitinilytica]MBM9887247.1 glycosyltransferase family 4 protein [Deefgea sp. CFH1-16]